MPALPYPQYSIENLYIFPYYSNRDAYLRATGEEAPPWNPNRPPKHWCDPKAAAETHRNVFYDQTLVYDDKNIPVTGPDGKPVLDSLVLTKEEAATPNIPPTPSNVPGANVPFVPAPLRALEPNEELFFPFPGVVMVKNLDLYPSIENGFTAGDRALLRAIASKVGV